MKKTINLTPVFLLLGMLSIVSAGCVSSSGNYGSLSWDDTVKANFEKFEVTPGYDYYYYGPDSFPKVVIGLAQGYQMATALWRPIVLDSKQLRNWIWGQAHRKPGDINRYGRVIKDASGTPIGIWYAMKDWRLWARIEVGADNQVKISAPIENQNRRKGYGMFGNDS